MTTPGSDPSGYGENNPGSMPPPPAYDPGTGYPGQGAPVAAPKNGMGTAALVLGILAIVFCWTAVGGIILGALAIIFGIIGIRRAGQRIATNKGASIAGLVTGIVGLIIAIIFTITYGSILSIFGGSINDYTHCVQQANNDQSKIAQCQQEFQNQIQQQQQNNGG